MGRQLSLSTENLIDELALCLAKVKWFFFVWLGHQSFVGPMGWLLFAWEWCFAFGSGFINMGGGQTFTCVSRSDTFLVWVMNFVVFDEWVFVKVQIYALVGLTKMITIIVSFSMESSNFIQLRYSPFTFLVGRLDCKSIFVRGFRFPFMLTMVLWINNLLLDSVYNHAFDSFRLK